MLQMHCKWQRALAVKCIPISQPCIKCITVKFEPLSLTAPVGVFLCFLFLQDADGGGGGRNTVAKAGQGKGAGAGRGKELNGGRTAVMMRPFKAHRQPAGVSPLLVGHFTAGGRAGSIEGPTARGHWHSSESEDSLFRDVDAVPRAAAVYI